MWISEKKLNKKIKDEVTKLFYSRQISESFSKFMKKKIKIKKIALEEATYVNNNAKLKIFNKSGMFGIYCVINFYIDDNPVLDVSISHGDHHVHDYSQKYLFFKKMGEAITANKLDGFLYENA